MRLSLGFSSCPNDTFVFDAMVHGKLDTEGLTFDPVIADVEQLNRLAFNASAHITKLSYNAYPFVAGDYMLLNSGSALGRGNGPLLISKKLYAEDEIPGLSVAIPGKMTTANLLFSVFYPGVINKTEMLFSDIEEAILSGKVDAGVIIHESRFTYQGKGLIKITDLGERWEETSGQPVPLGAIIAKRDLGLEMLQKIDRILRKSVEYAISNPASSRDFVKLHAQELDDNVIDKHISLYVNRYTVSLGSGGRMAVQVLFEKAIKSGLIPELPDEIFVPGIDK
jgi:1,4-dihydroxy-6-naphthoate synthase